jgi:hypothetical protein
VEIICFCSGNTYCATPFQRVAFFIAFDVYLINNTIQTQEMFLFIRPEYSTYNKLFQTVYFILIEFIFYRMCYVLLD